tara:strand:+ start:490 stop:624 length:135 start_codon:yes stop_codon:yes gene_type:complete
VVSGQKMSPNIENNRGFVKQYSPDFQTNFNFKIPLKNFEMSLPK